MYRLLFLLSSTAGQLSKYICYVPYENYTAETIFTYWSMYYKVDRVYARVYGVMRTMSVNVVLCMRGPWISRSDGITFRCWLA